MRAAGPEIPGSGHFLVCDGTIWISILDYADSGRTLFQVDYDGALCFSSKQGRLRYVSAGDNWDYCDGTSWTAFGGGITVFTGLTDTPTDYTGAANKIVVVNGAGNALIFTDETDPEVNTLTAGKWCTTDGNVVNCTTNAPVLTEVDPEVNTLTTGKWCTTDGSVVDCTTNAPVLTEVDPEVNTLTAGKWCTTDGSVVDCTTNAPVLTEVDPEVNTLTAGKWCTTDGSVVDCTTNAPVLTEVDPEVNTLTTGKWCTTDGSVVNCTTNAPVLTEVDPEVNTLTAGKWCTTDGSVVDCTSDPTLSVLTDTTISGPAGDEILMYSAGLSKWVNAVNGAGVTVFTGLTDTPGNYTGAANKMVVVNGAANALIFTDETDPEVGTLTASKWCTTDGSVVDCTTNEPVLTEVDPKVNTLTSGKWCTTDGSVVDCTTNAPVLTEVDPEVNTLTAGKWCTTDGSVVDCTTNAPVLTEVDPEVNTLTAGKWCTTDGSVVNCTSDTPGGITVFTGLTDTPTDYTGAANKIVVVNGAADALIFTTETDPEVGTLTASKWCTTDGSVVDCTTNEPVLTEVDPKVNTLTSGKWCTTDGSVVDCTTNAPVLTEVDPEVNTLTASKWCTTDGSVVNCTTNEPVLTEVDPEINTLTASKWCTTDGSVVNCTTNEPVLTEVDPEVNTLTAGKWCTTDGSVVNCTSDTPGGTTLFTALTDTPGSFAGQGLKIVRVNSGATALEFVAGGGGSPAGANTQIQFNASGAFGASSNLTWDGTKLVITGDINYSGIAYDTSDIRLKTDIRPLEGSLAKLTSLKPIAFRMKGAPEGVIEYGFSAQDVARVFPALVFTEDDAMGTMSLNYIGLMAPMIEALKQQQTEIETLRTRLNRLEAYLATDRPVSQHRE